MQSASFPGQACAFQDGFAARELARFSGGFPGPRRAHAAVENDAGDRGVFLQEGGQLFRHQAVHHAAHFAVAQFHFGLPFKLRLDQLDRDDGRHALPDILAFELGALALEDIEAAAIVVDHARERGAEADQVGAAFDGIDVVGEGKDVFRIAVVILHGDFDGGVLAHALDINRARGKSVFLFLLRYLTNSMMPPS